MDNITIYEYAIIKGKLVKKTFECEKSREKMYRTSTKYNSRFFYMEYVDQIKSGRVFSLEDNENKYFQALIDDLTIRIEQNRQKLSHQEQILADIKAQLK